jgi:hypothetical protein
LKRKQREATEFTLNTRKKYYISTKEDLKQNFERASAEIQKLWMNIPRFHSNIPTLVQIQITNKNNIVSRRKKLVDRGGWQKTINY